MHVCLRHLRIGWHLYLLSHTAVPVTQVLVTPATGAVESKAQCPARSQTQLPPASLGTARASHAARDFQGTPASQTSLALQHPQATVLALSYLR